jgi:hypothetical protein
MWKGEGGATYPCAGTMALSMGLGDGKNALPGQIGADAFRQLASALGPLCRIHGPSTREAVKTAMPEPSRHAQQHVPAMS